MQGTFCLVCFKNSFPLFELVFLCSSMQQSESATCCRTNFKKNVVGWHYVKPYFSFWCVCSGPSNVLVLLKLTFFPLTVVGMWWCFSVFFNCDAYFFLISIRLIVKIKWQKASFQVIQRSFAEEIYFATLNCLFPLLLSLQTTLGRASFNKKKKATLDW